MKTISLTIDIIGRVGMAEESIRTLIQQMDGN